MPTLLWWGRSDVHYSRNQILLNLFKTMGWRVHYFRPVSSVFGRVQASIQRPMKPDLVWVPCFRQRDMASAVHWARKWGCPVVFDPLISSYQKEVFEKKRWPPEDTAAFKLHRWEMKLFQHADLVIADTHLHAEFYHETFGLIPSKISVIPVGADEQMFTPIPMGCPNGPAEVLFYGSFLQLHGPGVIIDAAAMTKDSAIQWVLLGDGDAKVDLQKRAARLSHVRFEPWIDYARLPKRLSRAHIVLGIFGKTHKASMVIPNKVFQAMAMGKPLITCTSEAYPHQVRRSQIIGWVPPGDAPALASCVTRWLSDPGKLEERGRSTRSLYDQYFSIDHIASALREALEKVL